MRKQAVPSLDFIGLLFLFHSFVCYDVCLVNGKDYTKTNKSSPHYHLFCIFSTFSHKKHQTATTCECGNVGFQQCQVFSGYLIMLWLSHTREKIGQQPSWQLEKLVVVLGLHCFVFFFNLAIYTKQLVFAQVTRKVYSEFMCKWLEPKIRVFCVMNVALFFLAKSLW